MNAIEIKEKIENQLLEAIDALDNILWQFHRLKNEDLNGNKEYMGNEFRKTKEVLKIFLQKDFDYLARKRFHGEEI